MPSFIESSSLIEIKAAEPNDLVQRALRGCVESYSELAKRFYPKLVHLLLPRIHSGSHMDAEDIAQEALTRSFQSLDQFDPTYRFSTWLYTIAIRIATDHNRGRRRRLMMVESHRTTLYRQDPSVGDSTLLLEQREEVDSIWKIARQVLSPSQYTATWLRFGEELTVAEIAKVMQKTKVGTRVVLHRARVKLMKELNKEEARPTHPTSLQDDRIQ